MLKYTVKRLLLLIPVLVGITFLSFAMMRLAGGDAVTYMYENARNGGISGDHRRGPDRIRAGSAVSGAVRAVVYGDGVRRYGYKLCIRP